MGDKWVTLPLGGIDSELGAYCVEPQAIRAGNTLSTLEYAHQVPAKSGSYLIIKIRVTLSRGKPQSEGRSTIKSSRTSKWDRLHFTIFLAEIGKSVPQHVAQFSPR